jgi:dihydrofolate synthase/folylpolyglutamate synthase
MPTDPFDYPAAIEYLYSQINYERTAESKPYAFRLRRMRDLLEMLALRGVAGDDLPVVHIAGTKGKGSTATMVAAMLTASGVRTGLYTSPHLIDLEERFVVDGQPATKPEVASLVAAVRDAARCLASSDAGPPTFFELTTAVALLHFKNRDCGAVVLEVGLGGRLDSTNVCVPAVTAITSIGLDHQHILGNTLGEIAFQKAGIIKPGVPVVSGLSDGEAADVIEEVAGERGAPLFKIGTDFESICQPLSDDWGSRFDLISKHPSVRGRVGWRLPLDGSHQGRNAAIACTIMDLLERGGVRTSLEAQMAGMANVKCAGRIERFRLPDGAEVIIDTAHNADSIAALCNCLDQRAGGRKVTIIFGTSRDKDHIAMLSRLCDTADRLILTRYHGNPRYRETAELLVALPQGKTATIEESPEAALAIARQAAQPPADHLIVVCGSFFLAAEVRPLLASI